ncbi:hypothetical protein QVD17_22136 [Tagetes erecta]|uniref:Reverse transcriptase Ty1/copia-type domain-containing protein n=1 Tax=Tagetes erecta TaxID=13708 RepID=A0AAD8KHJ0_TARER|nr:hypothetical protein QVD17_22136 [Tagetes erecta]
MDSLTFTFQPSNIDSVRHSRIQSKSLTIGGFTDCNVRITSNLNNRRFASVTTRASFSNPQSEEKQQPEEGSVEEVRIPKAWLNASKALEARLVYDGRSQQVGIDCGETFSPVVKPSTIRTVLSLALSHSWSIHQLDVKNAFLHGNLTETVYMHQPPGFKDQQYPNHVCLLQRSLYGLKQAPRAWYQRFAEYVASIGFIHSQCDHSLFIYRKGHDIAYILLYVDDIILITSTPQLHNQIMSLLSHEFAMKDLGPLTYFLGIAVTRHSDSLFLSQQKYAKDVIDRAGMSSCKPVATPVDTNTKLSATDGDPFENITLYRQLAGALQYLTFTRPDISYAVQQICIHMHAPRTSHFNALKRILRYIQGTINFGLTLSKSGISSLIAYTDADWGGCPDTRHSTSGYCVYMGDNLLSWSSKRQSTMSRSSAEAEYRGVANVVSEISWLRNLLLELHHPLSHATLVYCDNVSAIYLSGNPVQHQRTKHIEMDIHFVREQVRRGRIHESEWLRATLHKWLDDEYCPEPTNVDISNVAARSYYKSLIENQTDLGDILLRMAMELETISYQESFHGAFSSANAAINLILERILHE